MEIVITKPACIDKLAVTKCIPGGSIIRATGGEFTVDSSDPVKQRIGSGDQFKGVFISSTGDYTITVSGDMCNPVIVTEELTSNQKALNIANYLQTKTITAIEALHGDLCKVLQELCVINSNVISVAANTCTSNNRLGQVIGQLNQIGFTTVSGGGGTVSDGTGTIGSVTSNHQTLSVSPTGEPCAGTGNTCYSCEPIVYPPCVDPCGEPCDNGGGGGDDSQQVAALCDCSNNTLDNIKAAIPFICPPANNPPIRITIGTGPELINGETGSASAISFIFDNTSYSMIIDEDWPAPANIIGLRVSQYLDGALIGSVTSGIHEPEHVLLMAGVHKNMDVEGGQFSRTKTGDIEWRYNFVYFEDGSMKDCEEHSFFTYIWTE